MRSLLCLFLSLLPLVDACRPAEQRLTVVLFDTSGSVHSDVLEARYTALAARLIDAVQPGDRLAADRITAHSGPGAHLALNVAFPRREGRNKVFFEQDLSVLRDSARLSAARLLETPPAPCTDLLGAFDLPARLFQGQPHGVEKRLVVASDMVQTCGGVNFRHLAFNDETAGALIEAARAEHRLPDLAGVTVWVAGAGTDTTLTSARHAAIEHFWRAYFAAAGATLARERYAPTLLHWE